MFFTKNNLKKQIPLIFVLVFNFWLIRIIQFNLLIGAYVIFASVILYLSIIVNKKQHFVVFGIVTIILLLTQYKTSSINSLTFLNEIEKIEQEERTRGYPRPLYRFANWLELRKEAVVFYKIQENFSEVADANIFFFANHPRERVGIIEYEKFPYIFLPFFIIGILSSKKSNIKSYVLLLSPVILLSLIGNSNPIGPFSLFPAIATFTAIGLAPVFGNRKYLALFLLVFSLVFIQTFSYATH